MTPDISAPADLLGLFPPGSRVDSDGELVVGGCRVADLAATWGTPLFVVDEGAVRAQVGRFGRALAAGWENSRMVFASKAFPCTAMYRLMASEGIGVDVAGPGELAMALAGGVDPALIIMHGNAKTTEELQTAVGAGVGLIVIDNDDDIDRLEDLVTSEQPVLVRVIPGVRPDTHEAVATGQAGSKFGLPIPAARAAIARLRHSDKLRLDGVHMHIGSQILSPEPYAPAIEAIAGLGEFPVYDLGGGLGARYTYSDDPPSPEDWVEALLVTARKHLPPDAQIIIEPGRSLVAPFGVTLYRVVSVKGDDPRFVAVNGGMADNMEVALYGQRFEATVTSRVGGGDRVDLVGRHCESGDRLISGVPLRDPRPGDLVAVAATGAYCYSLASNYNGAMRPPVVFCEDGRTRLVVRRETIADFLSRDVTEGLSTAEDWFATSAIPFGDPPAARARLTGLFTGWHPRFTALIAACDDTILPRSIAALPVGLTWPPTPGITLLGDAAHLMPPVGQGANMALLDGALLGLALAAHPDDFPAAVEGYEREMFDRTGAAARQSAHMQEILSSPDASQQILAFFQPA